MELIDNTSRIVDDVSSLLQTDGCYRKSDDGIILDEVLFNNLRFEIQGYVTYDHGMISFFLSIMFGITNENVS